MLVPPPLQILHDLSVLINVFPQSPKSQCKAALHSIAQLLNPSLAG